MNLHEFIDHVETLRHESLIDFTPEELLPVVEEIRQLKLKLLNYEYGGYSK